MKVLNASDLIEMEKLKPNGGVIRNSDKSIAWGIPLDGGFDSETEKKKP